MKTFYNLFSVILFLIAIQPIKAQKVDLFRSIYFPAEPYGGPDELKDFVKQIIVYPAEAIKNKIEGEVFINFKIDHKGKVIFKQVADTGNFLLKTEAEQIFDRIVWEADPKRNTAALGYEKLKFHFKIKKYNRLCKKRGYIALPYGDYPIDSTTSVYTINQVDEKPSMKDGGSLNSFISKNFKYPSIAYERNLSGRVTIEFVIEPYGLISNVRIVEAVAGGCNEETKRLMEAVDWKPGFKNGKAVRTIYQYQLNFVHPGGTVR